MVRTRFTHALAALACALGTLASAQQAPQRLTVPFTDPARPGTVRVEVVSGSITVRGANRRDVQIEVRPRAAEPDSASTTAGGLRRLQQTPSFSVEEEGNVVSVEVDTPNRPIDFELQVPARANLKLGTVNGGNLLVEGVEGELEIQNVNGSITLTNVGGAVVANTVNGFVRATLTRVLPDKAMAFTSLNGAIDVTLPATVKANLKLRSDRGDVFTDFDLQQRPTPAAPAQTGGRRTRIEIDRFIYGAINGGGPDIEMRTFNGTVHVRRAGVQQ